MSPQFVLWLIVMVRFHRTSLSPSLLLVGALLFAAPIVAQAGGAFWTTGATNPLGQSNEDRWADAMNQLHREFRRDFNVNPVPVIGCCRKHCHGFEWRTPDNAATTLH